MRQPGASALRLDYPLHGQTGIRQNVQKLFLLPAAFGTKWVTTGSGLRFFDFTSAGGHTQRFDNKYRYNIARANCETKWRTSRRFSHLRRLRRRSLSEGANRDKR